MNFSLPVKSQTGLTLIELLIAVVLGLVLSAGALLMFISNKQTATLQEQFAGVQENGRFATDILMREIRPVGYFGCGSATPVVINTLKAGTGIESFDFSRGVYGYEASGGGWANNNDGGSPDSDITDEAVAGTDILMFKVVEGADCRVNNHEVKAALGGGCGCPYTKCLGQETDKLEVSAQCGLAEDDIVIISDCVNAAIFQITDVDTDSGVSEIQNKDDTNSPGNCTEELGSSYVNGSIMKMYANIFMVKNNASGVPSLYRYRNNVEQELIEGVEDLQLTYGEDTSDNGAVNVYRTADNVSDWDNVLSIRLNLLVRSLDTILENAQTIGIDRDGDGATETVDTSDMRLRQVFSTTVVLRNRMT